MLVDDLLRRLAPPVPPPRRHHDRVRRHGATPPAKMPHGSVVCSACSRSSEDADRVLDPALRPLDPPALPLRPAHEARLDVLLPASLANIFVTGIVVLAHRAGRRRRSATRSSVARRRHAGLVAGRRSSAAVDLGRRRLLAPARKHRASGLLVRHVRRSDRAAPKADPACRPRASHRHVEHATMARSHRQEDHRQAGPAAASGTAARPGVRARDLEGHRRHDAPLLQEHEGDGARPAPRPGDRSARRRHHDDQLPRAEAPVPGALPRPAPPHAARRRLARAASRASAARRRARRSASTSRPASTRRATSAAATSAFPCSS